MGGVFVNVIAVICQKIWTNGQWSKDRDGGTQLLITHPSEKRQHTTLAKLQNDQSDLSSNQSPVTDYSQETGKPGRTDLGRGTSRFQITEEYTGVH